MEVYTPILPGASTIFISAGSHVAPPSVDLANLRLFQKAMR